MVLCLWPDWLPCEQITPTSMLLMAPHLSNLRYLNLDYCSQTEDSFLFAIAQHCPQLSRLQVCSIAMIAPLRCDVGGCNDAVCVCVCGSCVAA